jgi:hypothetical protein
VINVVKHYDVIFSVWCEVSGKDLIQIWFSREEFTEEGIVKQSLHEKNKIICKYLGKDLS